MKDLFITIKEVRLNNNCPECFSKDGLKLTFKQKFVETKFSKSITSEINQDIICETCNSTIYPVNWHDDLERIFEYHKKTLIPKNPSRYYKKSFWAIIIPVLVVIIMTLLAIAYYTINKI